MLNTTPSRAPQSLTTLCQTLALGCLALAAFCVGISVTATSICFVLAFILSLLSGRWLQGFKQLRANPALLSFWLLFALYLVGLTYTISPPHDAWRDLQKMHWLLMTPFFACLFDHERWRQRLLDAFLMAMAVTLVLSFAKAAGVNLPPLISHVSGNNVFFEHIVQTFFLNVAAFIAAYRACTTPKHRWLYSVFALLITFNVFFLSESATGFITYAAFLTYLLAWRFGWKGLALSVVVAFSLAVIVTSFSHPVRDRIQTTKLSYQQYQAGHTQSSLGLRLAMWQNAKALLQKAPWYGYGTGGIKQAMQDKLNPTQIERTGFIDYVEISPLNFLLQFGVIGLAVLITLIWLQFKATTFLPAPYRPLMQGFLLAYFAASLFNCFFISFCETHLYALFAAVCFSSFPTTLLENRRDLAYA